MISSFNERLEPPPIDYFIYSLIDYFILLVEAPGIDSIMDSLIIDSPIIDSLIADSPAIDSLMAD